MTPTGDCLIGEKSKRSYMLSCIQRTDKVKVDDVICIKKVNTCVDFVCECKFIRVDGLFKGRFAIVCIVNEVFYYMIIRNILR